MIPIEKILKYLNLWDETRDSQRRTGSSRDPRYLSKKLFIPRLMTAGISKWMSWSVKLSENLFFEECWSLCRSWWIVARIEVFSSKLYLFPQHRSEFWDSSLRLSFVFFKTHDRCLDTQKPSSYHLIYHLLPFRLSCKNGNYFPGFATMNPSASTSL